MPPRPGTRAWPPSLPFVSDLARDGRDLLGEGPQRIGHVVDRVGQRGDLALRLDDEVLREVTVGDRRDDLRDAADLAREVRRHHVHVVGEVLPRSGHARHLGLSAEPALRPDLAGDARHLGGERPELIDHRVDGVLELEDLALGLDGDLRREVAVGDRRRDGRDVPHLRGEVRSEQVHVVGEVLPRAGDVLDVRLSAELALGADLFRDARHLRCEGAELLDHPVDGVLELEDLAARLDGDLLRQVAVGHGGRHRARCCGPDWSGCRRAC